MTEPELEVILAKHCESEAEMKKVFQFLETEAGEMRFKTLLRERLGPKPERKFEMGRIVVTRGTASLPSLLPKA